MDRDNKTYKERLRDCISTLLELATTEEVCQDDTQRSISHKANKLKLASSAKILESIVFERSKQTLIILEIDNFLTTMTYDPNCQQMRKANRFYTFDHTVICRQGYLDFVQSLIDDERYEVGIWSTLKSWKLDKVLEGRIDKDSMKFVWGQKKCLESSNMILKDVQKVWDAYAEYDKTNTILIESDTAKCNKKFLANYLEVEAFDFKESCRETLEDVLDKIHNF